MMVAGGLTAFVLVWGIELIGHLIFPLPEDLDLRNPEVADQALGSIPLPAKLIVVFAWFTGALGGGYVASRIRGRWWSPWLIASLVALSAIGTIMMIPHPVWMQIAAVVAPLLGALAPPPLARTRPKQQPHA